MLATANRRSQIGVEHGYVGVNILPMGTRGLPPFEYANLPLQISRFGLRGFGLRGLGDTAPSIGWGPGQCPMLSPGVCGSDIPNPDGSYNTTPCDLIRECDPFTGMTHGFIGNPLASGGGLPGSSVTNEWYIDPTTGLVSWIDSNGNLVPASQAPAWAPSQPAPDFIAKVVNPLTAPLPTSSVFGVPTAVITYSAPSSGPGPTSTTSMVTNNPSCTPPTSNIDIAGWTRYIACLNIPSQSQQQQASQQNQQISQQTQQQQASKSQNLPQGTVTSYAGGPSASTSPSSVLTNVEGWFSGLSTTEILIGVGVLAAIGYGLMKGKSY